MTGNDTKIYGPYNLTAGTATVGATRTLTTTGTLTVGAGGTLGGSGTVISPSVVVVSGGVVSPGSSVGTLSVQGNVQLGGVLKAEVSGAAIDKLAITGGLTLGPGSVLDIQGTLNDAVTYVIASYNAGTLVGTFGDALDATMHGYNVVYENSQISLDELDGDANHDGIVNIFDINLVSSSWNPAGPVGLFTAGNVNHDTVVNIFDINLISFNWNHVATNGGPAHAQPEPSSIALLSLGLVAFAVCVWRGRPRVA